MLRNGGRNGAKYAFRQGGIKSQQLAALRESVFLGSIGEKAEVI
jgi:hypothetical protein